jgi:hypothetical protein
VTAAKYDYRTMKDEYVASDDLSIRDLAIRHGVQSISSVQRMARIQGWEALRQKRQAKGDEKMVEKMADREAARRARRTEVLDNALEAIDEAIGKLRTDMKATKKVRDPETNQWTTEPVVRYRPAEVVQLMDRIQGLFGDMAPKEPTQTEGRFFGLTANLDGADPEQLRVIAGLAGIASSQTRDAEPRRVGDSPLPSSPGPRPDQ